MRFERLYIVVSTEQILETFSSPF